MSNDAEIVALIKQGRLRVNAEEGLVFAPRSNTPDKSVGALTRKGYLRVCIDVAGRQRHFMVHRIVWVSLHGPVPDGMQIDHGNGIKSDNRIDNLEAVTGDENMKRGVAAGAFKNVGRRDGIRDAKGRFGKKRAGRLLDGRTWDQFPA